MRPAPTGSPLVDRTVALVPDWWWRSYPWAVWERLVEVRFLDRALVIAAQEFVAVLPLVIILSSLLASDDSLAVANSIIDRFGLSGAAVLSVRALFAVPGDAQSSANVLGLAVVLFSALSLSRRVRATYEAAFRLAPRRGGILSGFGWVGLQVVALVVGGWLRGFTGHGPVVLVLVVAGLLLLWGWLTLLSARLLLADRVDRARLLPLVVATTVGLVLVNVYSAVWLPHTLSREASTFGPIGVAFTIFSWLLAIGFAIVVGAVLGAVWSERRLGAPPGARSAPYAAAAPAPT